MKLVHMVLACAVAAGGGAALAQTLTNPSRAGDVFIDHHGSTVQLTACRGSGPTEECQVRVLKQAAGGSTYGGIWWTLDNLRDSERVGVRGGLAPYSGPRVPLPGAAAAAPPVARPPVRTGTIAPPPAGAPTAPVASGGRCTPPTPYTRAVSASRAPSPALFREVIANKFTVDGNAQYPRRVDFHSLAVGAPVTNTVGMTNQGANRVTNGAPAGAQLYPIRTSFTVCKAEWTKAGRYDSTYFCWRAGTEWTCGVSESRVTMRVRGGRMGAGRGIETHGA